jgi:hypothetical protein
MGIAALHPSYELGVRHCEERERRSNPSGTLFGLDMDCFASLAMTGRKPAGWVSNSLVARMSEAKSGAFLRPAHRFARAGYLLRTTGPSLRGA